MQVVFSLARAGHAQHVPAIVERMRHERGYVPGMHTHLRRRTVGHYRGGEGMEEVVR